jgi:hypothetical protein
MPSVATTLVSSMNPAIQGAARQAMQAHADGENGIQAFAENLPGMIVPTILAVGIGYFTSYVVDHYIAPVDHLSEREKMYAEMREIARKAAEETPRPKNVENYYQPRTPREEPKPFESKVPRTLTPAEQDMYEMTNLVKSAKTKLKEAKMDLVKAEGKSKCSYCKATLTELSEKLEKDEEVVDKETEFILSTSEKWSKMQDLKATGKLRSTATWDTMTPQERKLVGGI